MHVDNRTKHVDVNSTQTISFFTFFGRFDLL